MKSLSRYKFAPTSSALPTHKMPLRRYQILFSCIFIYFSLCSAQIDETNQQVKNRRAITIDEEEVIAPQLAHGEIEYLTGKKNSHPDEYHDSFYYETAKEHQQSEPRNSQPEVNPNVAQTQLQSPKTEDIDFIFPAPKKVNQQAEDSYFQSQTDLHKQISETHVDDSATKVLKLLFSWKKVLSKKCSKPCGKGYQHYSLQCFDLKYNVRVEDAVCITSNLPKPDTLSDSPCNQIDCPPKWMTIEYEACNATSINSFGLSGSCQPEMFKRVECTMINFNGILIYLNESDCSKVSSSKVISTQNERQLSTKATTTAMPTTLIKESSLQDSDDKDNDIDISYSTQDEKTIEESSYRQSGEDHYIFGSINDTKSNDRKLQSHIAQPNYDVQEWSSCNGTICGELGWRTRKLKCRLYLEKSSRFTDLPEASCLHVQRPIEEEPCYVDCAPPISTTKNPKSVTVSEDDQLEEFYDKETRYVWRDDVWTKCSAECLGGKRKRILECWDKVEQSIADLTKCSDEYKPEIIVETCNEKPCLPEWKAGVYSKCSKLCGSSGFRERRVSCVQKILTKEGEIEELIVPNELCKQQLDTEMPTKVESCNRIDCKPEWVLGPWSACSKRCGEGLRNRSVACVQEFGSKDHSLVVKSEREFLSSSAISTTHDIYSSNGAITVPVDICIKEFQNAPSLTERCRNQCNKEPFIDSEQEQNIKIEDTLRNKTIHLKVGGRAQVLEGKNVKIKCKLMNSVVGENGTDWRYHGVRIFSDGSRMSHKQNTLPDDNSVLDFNTSDNILADSPFKKSDSRLHGESVVKQESARTRRSGHSFLRTRSILGTNFSFVPRLRGRFSLIKGDTLKIKKMRVEDSGIYTCHHGSLKESISLNVLSFQELYLLGNEEKISNAEST